MGRNEYPIVEGQGKRLLDARTAKGYTLSQLSEKCGGSPTSKTINKYELEKAGMSPQSAEDLSKALGVRKEYLLGIDRYMTLAEKSEERATNLLKEFYTFQDYLLSIGIEYEYFVRTLTTKSGLPSDYGEITIDGEVFKIGEIEYKYLQDEIREYVRFKVRTECNRYMHSVNHIIN